MWVFRGRSEAIQSTNFSFRIECAKPIIHTYFYILFDSKRGNMVWIGETNESGFGWPLPIKSLKFLKVPNRHIYQNQPARGAILQVHILRFKCQKDFSRSTRTWSEVSIIATSTQTKVPFLVKQVEFVIEEPLCQMMRITLLWNRSLMEPLAYTSQYWFYFYRSKIIRRGYRPKAIRYRVTDEDRSGRRFIT